MIDAIGLGNITSLGSVNGLDGDGFVSRTLVALDGEPAGLLRLLNGKALTPADLAPIPRDATLAMALRLDASDAMETLLTLAGTVEPRARQEFERDFDQIMGKEIGISIRDDLLKPLGDTWCFYNSPGEGGFLVTGMTGVVQVKDREKLAAALEKIVAAINANSEKNVGVGRMPAGSPQFPGRARDKARIGHTQFAGQEIYFLEVPSSNFFLAPAWCLTEKELIVSTWPQHIKAYLSRDKQFESLAKAPEVAELFKDGDGPVSLSYCDTQKFLEVLYPMLCGVGRVMTHRLARDGIDLDTSIIPSPGALKRHLRPTVGTIRRTKAGIEIMHRGTLPGADIAPLTPMVIGFLAPATMAVRENAHRAGSMNNLKQIALAMLNYDASNNHFPAAFTADKTGKPLLSWRVAILPYLGQSDFYKQFHLDEPWDSDHNKRLIPLMPQIYRSPANSRPASAGLTNYVTIRHPDSAFPGKDGVKPSEITRGLSNAIMVIEARDAAAVIWTKPDDLAFDEKNLELFLSMLPQGKFSAAFCDGSVRVIGAGIGSRMLRELIMRHDSPKSKP